MITLLCSTFLFLITFYANPMELPVCGMDCPDCKPYLKTNTTPKNLQAAFFANNEASALLFIDESTTEELETTSDNPGGCTYLISACTNHEFTAVVQRLLERNVSLLDQSENGDTAFIKAVCNGSLDKLSPKALLIIDHVRMREKKVLWFLCYLQKYYPAIYSIRYLFSPYLKEQYHISLAALLKQKNNEGKTAADYRSANELKIENINETRKQFDPFTKKCSYCHKYAPKEIKLPRCMGCKIVRYCSKECQKKHWTNHKKICSWQSIKG